MRNTISRLYSSARKKPTHTIPMPHLIIPRNAEPTPRFSNQIFKSIEEELFKPVGERQLPTREFSNDIREFGLTPTLAKIPDIKGKIKPTIKNILRNYNADELEVEYIEPAKPREKYISPRAVQRQARMSETVQLLISQILHHHFAANTFLNSTKVSITSVEVSLDLTKCIIGWLPFYRNSDMVCNGSDLKMDSRTIERYQNEFEKAKGPIRWKVTEKLSYLRQSPELIFQFDERQWKLYQAMRDSKYDAEEKEQQEE